VKGQKKEILTRLESQHSNRPDIFYFLPIAYFLKQLPTHIAHIAKAPQANAETKALPKSAIFPLLILILSGNILQIMNYKIMMVKEPLQMQANEYIITYTLAYTLT